LGRTIQGDVADYDLKAGKVVVTGSPAIIQDPTRGKSAAARLTFFTADDRILLENK
jgi:2-keto-4-pentenoate hydratase